MLRQLGDPAPGIGTVSHKTARAIHLARACRVELLLFDEANRHGGAVTRGAKRYEAIETGRQFGWRR